MTLITGQDFKRITIRARVAYSICCLENAVKHYKLNHLDWSLLFEFYWNYPKAEDIQGLALWHENEAECSAFCIMENLSYKESDFEFINNEQYEVFKSLYSKSNDIICKLSDLITAIGTQNLFGGVRDGAPVTLNNMQTLINIMLSKKIELPNFSLFELNKYPENPESDWIVWGNKIEFAQSKFKSNWIK